MSDFKSDREKKMDLFFKQLENQNEWEIKISKLIKKFYDKFKEELEDYIFIKDVSELYQVKIGGYII